MSNTRRADCPGSQFHKGLLGKSGVVCPMGIVPKSSIFFETWRNALKALNKLGHYITRCAWLWQLLGQSLPQHHGAAVPAKEKAWNHTASHRGVYIRI